MSKPLVVAALLLAACGGQLEDGEELGDESADLVTGCNDYGSARACYWFAEPTYGASDKGLRDGAVALVDGAPAGATVRITAFRWDDASIADAVVRAGKRGVHVKLIFDGGQPHCGAADATASMAKVCSATNVSHHFCSHDGSDSCLGQNILHAKVMTLSSTGGRGSVVWVGSHNWNVGSGTGVWNNAVAISGDVALYKGFQKWLDDMTAQVDAPLAGGYRDVFHKLEPKLAGATATAFFSPSGETGSEFNGDFVASEAAGLIDLGKKPCSLHVMPGDGWTNGRADVAHTSFNDTVVAYKKAGCDVKVLASEADSIESDVLAQLRKNGVPKRHHAKDEALKRAGTHDKLVLVKGFDAAGKAHSYVYFGSHNLQFPALRKNDEAMVKLADKAALFNAYDAHFLRAWNGGTAY